tara:strand:- start:846 stop:1166 length:321 start_codon:yes stop_codon:yes gene_type:complete
MGAPARKNESINSAIRQTSQSGLGERSLKPRKAQLIRRANAQAPDPHFEADDVSKLKVGQIVLHQRFGEGKVSFIAEGSNAIATINFSQEGEKKIMLKFAKLKIMD